ncbi:2004_t:CDS:1, partial [Gigaspora rosea]
LIVPLITSTTTCQDNNLACCAEYATSASRSVTIYLINLSDDDIIYDTAYLNYGAWTPDCSAIRIDSVPSSNAVAFSSGSDSTFGGTGGLASFEIGGSYITITWNNPYVGENSFSVVLSDKYINETISYGRNHVVYIVTIRYKSTE